MHKAFNKLMSTKYEDKKKPVEVVNKYNKELSPTNLFIANLLVFREKAEWIEKGKLLRLLKSQSEWKALKKQVIIEENRICYICGEKIPEGTPASIDHVYPKFNYGKDDRDNLRCCCIRCNEDKENMNISEYYYHVLDNIVIAFFIIQ